MQCDIAIVGGGIVGLATAYQLSCRHPHRQVVILEKEQQLAQHQTGHNSGVLHSGIYYQPGSLKARTCRIGRSLLVEFCRDHDIPFEICGKTIVAVEGREFPQLEALVTRGRQNGVDCELIDQTRLREIEPHAAGKAAVHVRDAGIMDFNAVCVALADQLKNRGTQILTGQRVSRIERSSSQLIVETDRDTVTARNLINCAGLYSDRVATRSGVRPPARIVPFRGEYYRLRPAASGLCRHLIYPVPDPRFPFLGVHLTRDVAGHVECGPNAVLAFAREGYRYRDINVRDLGEILMYRGTWRMAARHWQSGLQEWWRSVRRSVFLESVQRLVPDVQRDDLLPSAAGVRAQAVLPSGEFADDFLVERQDRMIHVCNAPSPAATASLQIGNIIAEMVDF